MRIKNDCDKIAVATVLSVLGNPQTLRPISVPKNICFSIFVKNKCLSYALVNQDQQSYDEALHGMRNHTQSLSHAIRQASLRVKELHLRKATKLNAQYNAQKELKMRLPWQGGAEQPGQPAKPGQAAQPAQPGKPGPGPPAKPGPGQPAQQQAQQAPQQAPPASASHQASQPQYRQPMMGGMVPSEEIMMQTKVATPDRAGKRIGKWSVEQLRQTDGIIPLQYGTNKFASQKKMTGFGTPRNTTTRIKSENLQLIPEDIARMADADVRLQAGSNKFASQRGTTGFGAPRDICREGVKVNINPADCPDLPEEKLLLSEGIVRLQSGTNRFASQKGMTGIGTARRETTKMVDTKHPEYSHEHPDQLHIPVQMGTNKFASQKGMTGFGTSRRETTKMVDTKHPDQLIDNPDQTTIPSQMGSNKFASQGRHALGGGVTGFGQPRWETLNPLVSRQVQKGQGIVPSQYGSNQFASQVGMTGFGAPRDVTYLAEGGELPYEDIKKSELIIPSQAGWNKGDSQKGYTGFGAPRDVKGKHLKRLWELEYPEEAEFEHRIGVL